MSALLAAPAALLVAAVLAAWLALRLLRGQAWLLGFVRGLGGLLLVAVAALFVLAALDLYSYRQLAEEQPVAELQFEQLGEQQFRATLTAPGADPVQFLIRGDYWQLDARFIKWKAVLARAGLPAVYRLDRLAGRYESIAQETSEPRSVFSIRREPALDIWAWLKRGGRHVALADAEYGSATYLPMAHRAHYRVFTTFSGLLARPVNAEAAAAVNAWSS